MYGHPPCWTRPNLLFSFESISKMGYIMAVDYVSLMISRCVTQRAITISSMKWTGRDQGRARHELGNNLMI